MKRYVCLTGGLGNQLFQFAALLSTRPSKICLITDMGNPRLSKSGKPDLIELIETKDICLTETNRILKFLSTKVFGYLLRLGVAPTKFEKKLHIIKIAIPISNIYFSILLKEKIRIFVSEGVGYSKINNKCNLLIGYFQSHQYLDLFNTRDLLIRYIDSKNASKLQSTHPKTKPVVVLHVRLGDYRLEESIGLLPKEYYEIGLHHIVGKLNHYEIWVFSDEPESVKSYIPENLQEQTKIFSRNIDNLESFHLMRNGNFFMLANSTFGWWAAQLSRNENVQVVVPSPWFKKLDEPSSLVPNNWHRIDVPGWNRTKS